MKARIQAAVQSAQASITAAKQALGIRVFRDEVGLTATKGLEGFRMAWFPKIEEPPPLVIPVTGTAGGDLRNPMSKEPPVGHVYGTINV